MSTSIRSLPSLLRAQRHRGGERPAQSVTAEGSRVGEVCVLTMIALFACALRVYLAQGGTYGADVDDWLMWSHALTHGHPTTFYARTNADYLPLYPTILWGLGLVYEPIKRLMDVMIGVHVDPLVFLVTFYKMPAILADTATSVVIYAVGRRWATRRHATIAAMIYALNPALIVNSARWGQVDSIAALFLLLALVALVADRPIWCGGMLALSIMTKPTAIVLLPIVVVAYLVHKRVWRLLVAMTTLAATSAIIAWPYAPNVLSLPAFLIQRLTATAGRWPVATKNAANLWALIDHTVRRQSLIPQSDAVRWLGLSQHLWGYVLLAGVVAVVTGTLAYAGLGRTTQDRARTLVPTAVALTLAFFVLLTRMHERHMLPVLPVIALACLLLPRYWPVYAVLSVDYVINLYVVYPCVVYFPMPNLGPLQIQFVALSLLNIGALAACIGLSPTVQRAVRRLLQRQRGKAKRLPDGQGSLGSEVERE